MSRTIQQPLVASTPKYKLFNLFYVRGYRLPCAMDVGPAWGQLSTSMGPAWGQREGAIDCAATINGEGTMTGIGKA